MKVFWTHFFQSVIAHLVQIPYILWYPIASVINFVHSLFSYAYYWIDDRFKESVSYQHRLSRLTRKSVQTVLTGHSNVMSTFWSMRICYFFTLMLQFISLLTTYAGFTFFLKHINPFAPLFLALVIQGTFYFLINFRGARKREGNWKRWALLIILLLVSTTTSFVGISNAVRNPIEDMKENYNDYRVAHNEYLSEKTQGIGSFSVEDIQSALYACENIRTNAQTLLTRVDNSLPDSIQNYWVEGIGMYDLETELKRASIRGLKEVTQGIIEELDNNSLELDANTIFQSIQDHSEDYEQNPVYQSFIAYLHNHVNAEMRLVDIERQLAEILNMDYSDDNVKQTIDFDLFSIRRKDEYNAALENENQMTLDPYESLIDMDGTENLSESSSRSFLQTIDRLLSNLELLLVSPELARAETVRNTLNQAMTKKYNLLSKEGRTTLEEVYKQSQIPSSQLYPFRYLITETMDSDWGTSLLAAFLAAMVDLLSLFLALTLIKRRDSVLYANNHKENVRNREEILEDCYTYLCMKKIMQNKTTQELTAAHIHAIVSQTIEHIMYDFYKKIHVQYIPDSIDGFGYITEADLRASSFEEYNLFQTLRMVSLIRPVTKNELMYLLKASFSHLKEEDTAAFLDFYEKELSDHLLFVVNNRLLMWHNENFSELLLSNLQYEDVVHM